MANLVTRRYGFPFKGYKSSAKRHLIEPGFVTGPYNTSGGYSSQGMLFDANDGKFRRRTGATQFGTATGVLEVSASLATARARRIYEMSSSSLADTYPAPLVLFTDDANRWTWLYWRSTNGSDYDLNLGETFGSTHYPASGTLHHRYIPLPYVHNATGLTRMAYEQNRRYFGQGSRTLVEMGGDIHAPGYYGTAARWIGKTFNDESGSGSEVERIAPIGLLPPLWSVQAVTASLVGGSASVRAWAAGDQCYYSVAFVNKSGEVSMPFIPGGKAQSIFAGSPPAGEYADRFGLVTVPSGSAYYEALKLIIPVGPGETEKRLLLRSKKLSAADIAAGGTPNPLELFVTAVIPNNTPTSYSDPYGNDAALVEDPNLVRLDRMWPYPARHNFTFDQRHCFLNLDPPGPCALILAPTGKTDSRDLNKTDDYAHTENFFVRVISGTLELKQGTGGGTVTQSITIDSSTSLQNVLETIQGTTVSSTADEWGAQIVPGADGDATTDNLALTYLELTCSASNGSATLTTAGTYTNVAVGMKIRGTNIAAGAYVKSVESTTSLTMSAVTTGAIVGGTISFAVDTGDDATVNDGTYGNVRAFCGSLPVVLGWKKSYLDLFAARPRDLMFTAGGPGDPPYAANSFTVGNHRTAPSTVGIGMGGGALLDGAVVLYSKAVARLRNIRDTKSGADDDYRNEVWSWGRGCISPFSIIEGNGWVAYLTPQGLFATDGVNEKLLTQDLYNVATGLGDLGYEIGQCQNAATTDGDGYGFHAHVRDGRIWISFRLSSTQSCVMCYDFSPSIEGTGLAQLLRPDGSTWGWSTPLFYDYRGLGWADGESFPSAIGSVRKSDGVYMLQGNDTNDGTNCGKLQRFEDGTTTENSSELDARMFTILDLCGTLKKKSLLEVRYFYKLTGSAGTGVCTIYRSVDRSSGVAIGHLLPRTGSADFDVLTCPAPLAATALADAYELLVTGETASVSAFELYGIEADYEIAESLRSQGG